MSNTQRTAEDYSALLQHVEVCVETGVITWATSHTGRRIGKAAGCVKRNGYIYINHMGRAFLAHRVVFFAATGSLPESLDHIDRNPTNNAISNLRPASQTLNNLNRGLMPFNKSGETGVLFYGPTGKWRAFIKLNARVTLLGDFDNKSDAVMARNAAKTRAMEAMQ